MNAALITPEQAVLRLREDPACASLVRDAYLGADVRACAEAFATSAEFAEVLTFIGPRLKGSTVLDVGAGSGIASFAFATHGVGRVIALEPDPSSEIGNGAIRRLAAGLPIQIIDTRAERIDVPDASIDVVYARQVLHHIHDLDAAMREFARVLKPGGLFIACRDHVVDDERQMQAFLRNHPVHQMTCGEHAHALDAYVGSMRRAGLRVVRIMRPWDSVINAFPVVRSAAELQAYPRSALERRFGSIGSIMSMLPFVKPLIRMRQNRALPGRLYSFFATKP